MDKNSSTIAETPHDKCQCGKDVVVYTSQGGLCKDCVDVHPDRDYIDMY